MTYLVLSGKVAVLRLLSKLRAPLDTLFMVADTKPKRKNDARRCRREFSSDANERKMRTYNMTTVSAFSH